MPARAAIIFEEHQQRVFKQTDRLFAGLLLLEYVVGIVTAYFISPLTWSGTLSHTHPHVWAALILGAQIVSLPIFLAIKFPGRVLTRHVIAIAQMLESALLIHLMGGRIEAHFHVFGSLAFLAFYRDWRVLLTAAFVTACDHAFRGVIWPQSVYGVASVSPWRWLEHSGWVVFECVFLVRSCVLGTREMYDISAREAELSSWNSRIELEVQDRTRELAQRNSELVASQVRAEAATQAKSEFLANMSHEIRTPMNGIIGMTELALTTPVSSEQREYLETVKISADSLLRILNDILDFSKVDADMLELENVPFSLREHLGDTLKSLAIRADEKQLELAWQAAADVPDFVCGDPCRIRQVIMNLAGNAIKFTHSGEIVVRVAVDEQNDDNRLLHFTVTDSGIGIPTDKIESIFDAFTQADASTTRNYGGTGLGLSISSRLVKLMGGKIWVESLLGRGSTFHFTLRLGLAEPPTTADAKPIPDLRNVSVLIVDDNATNRQILHEVLRHWHMKPTSVDSGNSALLEIQRAKQAGTPYSLVLTDCHMPGMDGFALAEQIQRDSKLSGSTIMMLTSAVRNGSHERCRQLGIASTLLKPIKQSELRTAIEKALEGLPSPQPNANPIMTNSTTAENSVLPLKILLAEDNAINQKFMVRLLNKRGHHVQVAENGSVAIAAWKAGQFDLILMDAQMPEMDGLTATRLIREQESRTGGHIPIIAMTAHAMRGDRERCLEAGMDEYVSKPVNIDDLFALFAKLPIGRATTANQISASESQPAFDKQAALQFAQGDVEILHEISESFVQDCPHLLATILNAIGRADTVALAESAHTLRGSAGYFGAQRATETVLKLEQLGRQSKFEEAEDVYLILEKDLAQLTGELSEFLGQSQADTAIESDKVTVSPNLL